MFSLLHCCAMCVRLSPENESGCVHSSSPSSSHTQERRTTTKATTTYKKKIPMFCWVRGLGLIGGEIRGAAKENIVCRPAKSFLRVSQKCCCSYCSVSRPICYSLQLCVSLLNKGCKRAYYYCGFSTRFFSWFAKVWVSRMQSV